MPTKKSPDNWELEIYPLNHDMKKSWFIQLEYTDPHTGTTIRKQYRNGINYYKTFSERMREAKDAITALNVKLSGGWDPITDSVQSRSAQTTFDQMPFNQALDVAMLSKQNSLSSKSYQDIAGVVKFAKESAIRIKLNDMPIGETKKRHIKMLLDQIGKDRQRAYNNEGKGKKWTGNSYNKYRGFLSIIFTELEDLEAVEFNPCAKISVKKEIVTNVHRHATDIETEKIRNHLAKKNRYFLTYLITEYMTGIRPKELFGLRIKDIDWLNQTFDVQATDEGSKTDTFRKVPIPNALLPHLEILNLSSARQTDFIFSEGFKPGHIYKNRKYATVLWKKFIKDELGIDVTLYSFKGKGGEAKRKAGIDEDAVSSGYGHATKNMSRIYLHGEADRINKQIIENTPAF
ncbi:MAG: site-specific integrase [Taibaiella sp.]|jgi:integrase